MTTSGWQKRLKTIRRGKDKYFRDNPQSPIPTPDRESFKGLDYYPLDPDYRFELELHEHDEKVTARLEATHGGERTVLRRGEFRFSIGGAECTLQAYQTDSREEGLFVPFGDATSSVETSDKGRYIDLKPEIHRTTEGKWILDFNEAYNPWCEYSDGFVCPFAPPENWLDVPVRAGEKSYAKSYAKTYAK